MTQREIQNKMRLLEQFGCFWGAEGRELRIQAKNELKSAENQTQLDNISKKYIKMALEKEL